MRQEIKDHLVKRYNRLEYKSIATCIKYHYIYNNVNVNIFFDAFEAQSMALCLILAYDNKYYYTSLNIDDTTIRTEYLKKIPSEILCQIIVDTHLTDFYQKLEQHILSDKPYVNTYPREKVFINTMKYSRNETDLPFWSHLRKVRMSDDTLNRLSASAHISRKVLIQIQEKKFTLVRTDKPERRKELTVILDSIGIVLS
ncbi:MAG: hypothetical protein KIC94_01450 [Clostridiales bacterium]|nr:hypothetical protein [Clostridiales bacterium]